MRRLFCLVLAGGTASAEFPLKANKQITMPHGNITVHTNVT